MSDDDLHFKAAGILEYANRLDPGLVAASLSMSDKTRAKQVLIARHYEAAGMRAALIMLGFDDFVELRKLAGRLT